MRGSETKGPPRLSGREAHSRGSDGSTPDPLCARICWSSRSVRSVQWRPPLRSGVWPSPYMSPGDGTGAPMSGQRSPRLDPDRTGAPGRRPGRDRGDLVCAIGGIVPASSAWKTAGCCRRSPCSRSQAGLEDTPGAALTVGPDGNLWFTEDGRSHVVPGPRSAGSRRRGTSPNSRSPQADAARRRSDGRSRRQPLVHRGIRGPGPRSAGSRRRAPSPTFPLPTAYATMQGD